MRSRLPFRDHPQQSGKDLLQKSARKHRSFSAGTCLLAAAALLPSRLPAQQLPGAAPTTSPQPTQPEPQRQQPHRSQVTLDNGLLTVTATNASLNGLIREIARKTGMKVSGSVSEDRVFGTYGPDDPQKVLATLLDGTGSNILILSNAADTPRQLILTPRTGAATPPNPNAGLSQNNEDDDGSPPPGAPTVISAPRARSAVLPGSVPAPPPEAATDRNAISPASETVVFPPPDATSTPSSATTTPPDTTNPAASSPDTVKTPQQIFEQLQRLRQQNTPAGQTPQ